MLADEEQRYGAGAGVCADDRTDEVDINVLHTEFFAHAVCDVEGVFAVDEWAKAQNCHVLEPGSIKTVSSTLLADKVVYYDSQWKITGTQPKNVFPADENHQADFSVTLHPQSDALHLVPKICVLGVGCKRGTSAEHIEAFTADQILPMVEADLGIGFVPEEFLEKWSNVCRIDLEEKIPERNVVVIKRKGQPLSVAANELEKMILAAEK